MERPIGRARSLFFAFTGTVILVLSLASRGALAQTGAGITFTNQRVTAAAPPATGCTVPPSVSAFLTTGGTAYLYFEANASNSDSLTNDWLAPDGTIIAGTTWTAASGNFCFTGASLSIGALPASQLGSWVARVYDNGNVLFIVQFTVNAPSGGSGPTISPNNGVVGGASFQPAITSGAWATLFGTNLSNSTRLWKSSDFINGTGLPTSLDGVSVMVDSIPAYVEYISPTQINILVPADNNPGPVNVQVVNNGATSNSVAAQLQTVSPAFFQWTNPQTSTIYAVATHADYSLAASPSLFSIAKPANAGEAITLWGTGFGQTNPATTIGQVTNGAPAVAATPTVTIGGVPAQVLSAVLSPGFAGLYQVAVQIPRSIANGDQPIVVYVNGVPSPGNVYLTVAGGVNPQHLSITGVSNTAPLPFTPLTINTTGLDTTAPVNVLFSNSTGYSVTTPAVRVSSSGVVTVAAPLYADPASGQIGAGAVTVSVSQGSTASNAVSLNAQDVPPISNYGTNLGDITHAMLVFDAMLIGQRINQLQTFQALPGNTIDTSQAQQTLTKLLNAVIQERSDVDNVAANPSTVIANGSLPNGVPLQFDQSSLDMMDRVNALFLLQTFANLPAPSASPQTSRASSFARVLTRFGRSGDRARSFLGPPMRGFWRVPIGPAPDSLTAPQSQMEFTTDAGLESMPAATARPQVQNRAGRVRQSSSSDTIQAILAAMKGATTGHDLAEGAQKLQDADGWVSQVEANAKFGTAFADYLSGIGVGDAAEELGVVGGLLQNVQVVGDVFAQLVAFADGEITGNQALVDVAVQAMDANQSKALGAGVDLALALMGGPDAFETTSTVAGFIKTFWSSGEQELEQTNALPAQLAAEAESIPNISQEFGTLSGMVNITNSNGNTSAQSGIELTDGNLNFTTIADPSGGFQLLVPLGVPGFDYSNATLEVYDPVSLFTGKGFTVLGSETVSIANLTATNPLQVPPITGACIDDDAGNPDADDPDCDN